MVPISGKMNQSDERDSFENWQSYLGFCQRSE